MIKIVLEEANKQRVWVKDRLIMISNRIRIVITLDRMIAL